jgi:hypothetical protein
LYACGSRAAFTGSAPEYSMPCDARKQRLVSFLERLPESSTVASVSVELPSSTLGSPPGSGRTIELSEAGLRIEGGLVPAGEADASFDRFVAAFATEVTAAKERDENARLALYVAAADSVTIGELRRYLVRVPDGVPLRLLVRANARDARLEAEPGTPERAREIAEGLLTELDAARRASLSREGYDTFSNCSAFDDGASKSVELSSAERWPALRRHALATLPGCSCEQFDTLALRVLFAAEQRAGAATLASVPFSFVKDERCGATMPLRSVKTLLAQMEKFDEADSADFENDAVTFDAIITNERLREQFCDALPGETLAALGRARRTVYWKLSGTECDAWQFEPMAKGAPKGAGALAGELPLLASRGAAGRVRAARGRGGFEADRYESVPLPAGSEARRRGSAANRARKRRHVLLGGGLPRRQRGARDRRLYRDARRRYRKRRRRRRST